MYASIGEMAPYNQTEWQTVGNTTADFWDVQSGNLETLPKETYYLYRVSTGWYKGYHGVESQAEVVNPNQCDNGKS